MGYSLFLAGILNVLTGIVPLFTTLQHDLNWTRYKGVWQLFSEQRGSYILSILLGLLLILLGYGLLKRKRYAWYWSLTIQILALVNNSVFTVNWFIITITSIYIFFLLVFKNAFYVHRYTPVKYEYVIAWLSLIFALLYGITGSFILQDQFHGISSLLDATYFTLVTYSTLGYGDITPFTETAKIFTISMILVGVGSFIATLTVILGPMFEKRLQGVMLMVHKFRRTNHTIIFGYNPLSRYVIKQLQEQNSDCIFIEKDPQVAQTIKNEGFHVIVGDPTSLATLTKANIEYASCLICISERDEINIVTAMTALERKNMTESSLKVIVRIENTDNIDKAKRAGATKVISPSILAGNIIAHEAITN